MSQPASLTQRSVSAASWSLAVQFCGQVINPLFGIILARVLMPGDYGLLGMLGIFWGIGSLFGDGGFGISLLQKKEVSAIEFSSVFYYNVFLGVLLYGIMVLAAPWIAAFYKQPLLVPLVRVLALTFVIGSLGSIQSIMLQKQLRQKVLAVIRIIVIVISGTLAVILGFRGYGVWALAWQQLASVLLGTILIAAYVQWRPMAAFSVSALRGLFRFGSRMFASGLLNCLFDNLYNVIIGRFYSPAELGYYTRANSYSGMWPLSISGAVSAVTLPALVQIQEDKARVRNAFRRSLICVTAAAALPTVLICVLSRPLVILLITERWLPIVPYMWVLSGVFLLMPVHIINLQLLTARGRSDLFLRLEIIKKLLILISVVATFKLGILAMVTGQLVVSAIALWINTFYTEREIRYSAAQQLLDILPSIICSVMVGVIVWLLNAALESVSVWLGAIGPLLIGPLIYIFLNLGFKTEASKMIIIIFAEKFTSVKFLRRVQKWVSA